MTALIQEAPPGGVGSSPRVKIRMLGQMAEALEDEVAGLYRRAATFEEEEFLLNREIGEHQTEINRLALRMEALRAERDRVIERIESISREAAQMREEVCDSEEELAVATIETSMAAAAAAPGSGNGQQVFTGGDPARSAMFFRRMTLAEDTSGV